MEALHDFLVHASLPQADLQQMMSNGVDGVASGGVSIASCQHCPPLCE